jgi:protein-tyrosine kinase
MGFFYQAIKKATGQADPEPDTKTDVPRTEQPANHHAPAAAAAAVAPAVAVAPAKQRRKLTWPGKSEKLVAVLSPPILDGHVGAMEECRLIRARLRELMRAKKYKTLMLTSSTAAEGKTLLSVNLAFALSQLENTRVLLVDADLRRPSVSSFLQAKIDGGLDRFLTSECTLEDSCYEITPSLHALPTLELTENSAELLHGLRMQKLLAEAASRYDVVLIDAPPLFPIADAQVLLPMIDAAVLVVRAEATSYQLAAQAAEILKGKCVGTILNCAAHTADKNSYYTYGRYKVAAAGDRA